MPSSICLGVDLGVVHPLTFSFPSPDWRGPGGWEGAWLWKPAESKKDRIPMQLLAPWDSGNQCVCWGERWAAGTRGGQCGCGPGTWEPELSFHLCTPLCVTLNESICLSGPWLPHMLSDPKRNLQLRHLVKFLTISWNKVFSIVFLNVLN